MSSMSFPNKKEYYASEAYVDPNGTAAAGSNAESAPAIDASIGSAAAVPFKLLAESIKDNVAKDSKLQSSKPLQVCVAAGAPAVAPPLTQIPSQEAIDKAMQELSPLFNNNLLGVANPIKLDQLYGLRLDQIIDLSLLTLVLAIYQKTIPEKRSLKNLLAAINEFNKQSWKQSSCKFVQKISIFSVCSAIDENQKKSFKSILEAIKTLSQFPHFYHTPYRLPVLGSAVNDQIILKFTNEMLLQLTQFIIPQMDLLLPILRQFNLYLLDEEMKAHAAQAKKYVPIKPIKPVETRTATSGHEEQKYSLAMFNKTIIYFMEGFLKTFKSEESPKKQLDENFLMQTSTICYWKNMGKNFKSSLGLLMGILEYMGNMEAYSTGRIKTSESEVFCRSLIESNINNHIMFYQSLLDRLIEFKNKHASDFNVNVDTENAGVLSALCVYSIYSKTSKDKQLVQKSLDQIKSQYKEMIEIDIIIAEAFNDFIKKTDKLFDKINLFHMSCHQDHLLVDEKFLSNLEKFVEIKKFVELNLKKIEKSFKDLDDLVEKSQNQPYANDNILDFYINEFEKKIKIFKDKNASDNFKAAFEEHLKSFNCFVNSDRNFSHQVKNAPLISQIKDIIRLLNPISETLIPIIDASRKSIILSREVQLQSVDYWLESIYDSRTNEIDPLEASEDSEVTAKDTASKKKSKFKGSKNKTTMGSVPIAVSAATTNVDKLLPKHTHHYASQSAKNFARMRWHIVEHHLLPSHIVVPNALVGKHTAIANVAIQQQIYPAESLQVILEILERSQNIRDQRLAVLFFFLYGQLFLEQSLTGPYISQFPDKKLTHRLGTLLKDLGLKGCDKWMEVNPWDTRCFRYPHVSLQNNRGTIPLALWHATQLTESSTKESKGILDQLVKEAVTLQQVLQKHSTADSLNENVVVGKESTKAPEADVKEASAADQKKMNSLGLKIEKVLLPLKEVVKKMPEGSFEEKKIKNTLKDVEYHLQNMYDLLGLVMRYGEQRFLFLHANIAMLSTQYLAENLGTFLSLMSGDDMRDHNLMAYKDCVDLGSKLKESDMATFQEINIRKGSEYLFQYFNNRHLSEISSRMHYLSGLYATSSMGLKELEGVCIDKSTRLSLAELHEEFYQFLEPLVVLATNLVNNHVLNDSVK